MLAAAISLAIVLLLACLIIWSLAKKIPARTRWSRSEANTAIYRQRKEELVDESDDETTTVLVGELGAEFLANVEKEEHMMPSAIPSQARLVLTIVVASVSTILYLLWGDPSAPNLQDLGEQFMQADGPSRLLDLAAEFESNAKRNPENFGTWFYLNTAYFRAGDFKQTLDSHKRAESEGHVFPLMDINALLAAYSINEGGITDEMRKLMMRVQFRMPNHPVVSHLYWIDSVRTGNFAKGVGHLERALGQVMSTSDREYLSKLLEFGRTQLDPQRQRVAVEVNVDEKSTGKRWLTVFLRGDKFGAPLAVVRRPLFGKGSHSFILDDSVSMTDTARVSDTSSVHVVARLSMLPTAHRNSGDIELIRGPIEPSATATTVFDFSGNKPEPLISIDLSVDVDATLDPESVVFVIARDSESKTVPVAVKRMSLYDLPAKVVLTDHDSMLPNVRLSASGTLDVYARVSRSGNVVAEEGDYVSEILSMPLGSRRTLVIDRLHRVNVE